MDASEAASEAVNRLQTAHAAAGLGRIAAPVDTIVTGDIVETGGTVDAVLAQLAAAIAPLRLPADLVAFWRAVDPDTLAVAPCPRPAGPELALRLWREHLAGQVALHRFLPWCYESHDFMLVELDGADGPGNGCFSWAGGPSPVVRAFSSVTAYVDLLATMLELREFTHHPQLGVLEFDPARCWADAQAVRLASGDRARTRARADQPRPGLTTVAALRASAAAGETPSGLIRARVLSLSGSASGSRIQVSDGTGSLDVWCPASLCANGPVVDRRFEFDVTLQAGCQQLGDATDELRGVERATRRGDLRAAVMLATPLYDKLFRTPAAAQARAIRPVG
jgi:hypothetical protein